jgi:hypothetical protein
MAGSQDMIIIVVMMMMMSSVFAVLAGGAYFFTKPQEGDECKGTSVGGNYVIDEDGDCVLDYCDSGYTQSGGGCVVVVPDGEEDESGSGSGSGNGEFVYEFIVNVHNESSLRLHLADIKVDGIRPDSSQVTINIQPNRYICGTKTEECETTETLGYIDAAGDMTWSAWDEEDEVVYTIGDVIFTITSPTKVNQFDISYQRPTYAPGWIIKENGVVVLTETANRGGDLEPTPITYNYTIP